jgi:hypothetical protein
MEAWKHGSMEAWKHGSMEAWKHGSMEAWKHGSMEAWKHVHWSVSAVQTLYNDTCTYVKCYMLKVVSMCVQQPHAMMPHHPISSNN